MNDSIQIDKNSFVQMGDMTLVYYSSYVDEFGNAIKRTPDKYKYSYDGFVTYRNGTNEEIENTVYSDRLSQWDYKKCDDLKFKHFGNRGDQYYNRTPDKIEAFVSEYVGHPIKLILIMEYCNQSNGFPLWRFDYKTIK